MWRLLLWTQFLPYLLANLTFEGSTNLSQIFIFNKVFNFRYILFSRARQPLQFVIYLSINNKTVELNCIVKQLFVVNTTIFLLYFRSKNYIFLFLLNSIKGLFLVNVLIKQSLTLSDLSLWNCWVLALVRLSQIAHRQWTAGQTLDIRCWNRL